MIIPTSIGLAADAEGNLYVAVPGDAVVHKVSPSGVRTVAAGRGISGFSGDGGPAASAQLRGPASVAVDASGNLYIGESGNLRIRKVTRDGVITTIAGTGVQGDSGDGGPAIAAQFKSIQGVAVDPAGNVYLSDAISGRVRKIAPNGIITTLAEQLQSPFGIAADGQGNVYVTTGTIITDGFRISRIKPNSQVERVTGSDGIGFAGDGGPAVSARIGIVQFVAADAKGNVYFGDPNNARVRKITADGRMETIAGNGTRGSGGDSASAIATPLGAPTRVAVDGLGNVFFMDTVNNSIRKVAPDGKFSTIPYVMSAGSPSIVLANSIPPPPIIVRQSVPPTISLSPSLPAPQPARPGYVAAYGISTPSAMLLDPDIRRRGIRGAVQLEFTVDEAGKPTDIKVVGSVDCEVDKAAVKAVRSWKYEPARQDGRPEKATIRTAMQFGGSALSGPAGAELKRPTGVAIDASGNLYVTNTENSNVRKMTSAGTVSVAITTGNINSPSDIAVDKAGALYVADDGNFRILKVMGSSAIAIAGKGTMGFSGDGSGAACAEVRHVQGIAVDKNGVVYIADTGNQRIRRVTTDGIITTIAGTGDAGFSGDGGAAESARLNKPSGIAVDAAGNLYVADTGNHRIRKIAPDGIITTIAGNGTSGFAGDGGPATEAQLSSPKGLGLDAAGTLYAADTGNHRVRRISAGGSISTVAGKGTPGMSGDGASALEAQLKSPTDVAVDPAGNLFISDTGNNVIRGVRPNGVISTVTGRAGK